MSATLYVESDTLFRLEEEDGSITAEILPGGVTLITAVARAGARLSGATTNGV